MSKDRKRDRKAKKKLAEEKKRKAYLAESIPKLLAAHRRVPDQETRCLSEGIIHRSETAAGTGRGRTCATRTPMECGRQPGSKSLSS